MHTRIAAGLLAAALLTAGCSDDHAGQMCARYQPQTTFVMVGKVMVPITTSRCTRWVNRP